LAPSYCTNQGKRGQKTKHISRLTRDRRTHPLCCIGFPRCKISFPAASRNCPSGPDIEVESCCIHACAYCARTTCSKVVGCGAAAGLNVTLECNPCALTSASGHCQSRLSGSLPNRKDSDPCRMTASLDVTDAKETDCHAMTRRPA
jgi:hypothetical protein